MSIYLQVGMQVFIYIREIYRLYPTMCYMFHELFKTNYIMPILMHCGPLLKFRFLGIKYVLRYETLSIIYQILNGKNWSYNSEFDGMNLQFSEN
jgi:hypothetical protein